MQFPPDDWIIRVEDLFASASADEMQDEAMSAQLLIHVDKNANIRLNAYAQHKVRYTNTKLNDYA